MMLPPSRHAWYRLIRPTAVFVLFWLLLLRPAWMNDWVYFPLLLLCAVLAVGELYDDYRRCRPRHRWRDLSLFLLSLSVVWLVAMPLFLLCVSPGERSLAAATFALGAVTLVGCILSMRRWRRLRREAAERLTRLRAERRNRGLRNEGIEMEFS